MDKTWIGRTEIQSEEPTEKGTKPSSEEHWMKKGERKWIVVGDVKKKCGSDVKIEEEEEQWKQRKEIGW